MKNKKLHIPISSKLKELVTARAKDFDSIASYIRYLIKEDLKK